MSGNNSNFSGKLARGISVTLGILYLIFNFPIYCRSLNASLHTNSIGSLYGEGFETFYVIMVFISLFPPLVSKILSIIFGFATISLSLQHSRTGEEFLHLSSGVVFFILAILFHYSEKNKS